MLRRLSSGVVGAGVLAEARRFLRFPIILHSENTQASVVNARELMNQAKARGKNMTNQHLTRVLNVAVALLQDGQYYEAKAVAEEIHGLVQRHRGPTHELVAFTATTCANCCGQLADYVERQLAEKRAQSMVPQDKIAGSTSKALTNERFLERLRLDEKRYREVAKRIVDMPERWYMRDGGAHEAASSSWEDSDSDRSANANHAYERKRRSATGEASDDGEERFSEGWKERRFGTYQQELRRSRTANGMRAPR